MSGTDMLIFAAGAAAYGLLGVVIGRRWNTISWVRVWRWLLLGLVILIFRISIQLADACGLDFVPL